MRDLSLIQFCRDGVAVLVLHLGIVDTLGKGGSGEIECIGKLFGRPGEMARERRNSAERHGHRRLDLTGPIDSPIRP